MSTQAPSPSESAASVETIPLHQPLHRAAAELAQAARACGEVQWVISALLERAHHPDLPAELHMLQDIDRLQQTLADLAGLIDLTAGLSGAVIVPQEELAQVIRLDSLRSRLFPQSSEQAVTTAAQSSDVTWL